MSGIYGMNIKMAIFGESHGPAIGLVIDGLPPGLAIDWQAVKREMARRAPGQGDLTTTRKESDFFTIESGFFNGYTTGTPFCALIANSGQHSRDYSELAEKMRPGHADYAGHVLYQGFNDYRGGGHFSGRLTAPLVLIGAICKQALAAEGITLGAHILSIGKIKEERFPATGVAEATLVGLASKAFPVLDEAVGAAMQAEIIAARAAVNSVGGVVEVMALNVPAGLGQPYFDSVESRLSHALFAIPAVKGVEFGDGFAISEMTGAEANDALQYNEAGKVVALTNHNGGITGGISNGMPLLLRVAIKPTPSIGRAQATINLRTQENTQLTIKGRHDPSIVVRAVPVLEAVTAWQLYDLLLEAKKWVR